MEIKALGGKKCRINKKCQIKMENLPPTSNFRGSRRVKVQEETRISSTVFFFPLYFPLRAFSKMSLTFRFPFAAGISRSCSRWWQDLWAQCNQDGSLCHSGSPQGQRWSAERQAPGFGGRCVLGEAGSGSFTLLQALCLG